jgi:hypothetical protein
MLMVNCITVQFVLVYTMSAEVTQSVPSDAPTHGNIRLGFVYERMPHITLKAIANNAESAVIWDKFQSSLERLRERLHARTGSPAGDDHTYRLLLCRTDASEQIARHPARHHRWIQVLLGAGHRGSGTRSLGDGISTRGYSTILCSVSKQLGQRTFRSRSQ